MKREPWRVDDRLWARVEPVLPVAGRRFRYPGRLPVEPRRCLEGILFVLFTGQPWQAVPAELGVSGVTCWRRHRAWQQAGVWERLLGLLREDLERRGLADHGRLIVDASIVPAKKGAARQGRARLIAAVLQPSGI